MHRKHVMLLRCHQLVISERSIFGLERSNRRPQRPNVQAFEYSSYHSRKPNRLAVVRMLSSLSVSFRTVKRLWRTKNYISVKAKLDTGFLPIIHISTWHWGLVSKQGLALTVVQWPQASKKLPKWLRASKKDLYWSYRASKHLGTFLLTSFPS